MPEQVLLRFRDLFAEVNTISAHNEIANAAGRVLWGWWKKPPELMPDPGLTLIKQDLTPNATVLLVDSAKGVLYRAPLFNVHYQPGGMLQSPPTPDLCPTYYRDKVLPAWFEIGVIEEPSLPLSYLSDYVYSHSNRTAPRQSATALPDSAIGQPVLDLDFLDSNISLWFIVPTDELGIRLRSRIVKGLSRGVWALKGKYVLHISDPHFGPQHAFRNQLSTRGLRIAKESLLEALLQDLEAIGISENDVALVLVTGDLTWAGDPHEFANAQKFLEGLCSKLGLHNSQVVIVPGNHDIEWRDEKGDVDDNAELNYANFCASFYGAEPEEPFLRIHRFLINERPVCIIGLNSCRIESKENAGLGFVGREQLRLALRFLNSNHRDNELRIALVHHHLMPVNYIEGIDWESKKVSIMLDAEAVLRSLVFARTRLVLHGHQHQPFISIVRRIVDGFVDPFEGKECCVDGSIAIVGGGSVGVDRAHINIIGRNSYNIIELSPDGPISVRTRLQSPVGPGFSDYQPNPHEL